MTNFWVEGPFSVPFEKMTAGRHITSESGSEFWAENKAISEHCGCYVYALRAGRGYKPIYIGKATRTFRQEVFSPHKLNKFNQGLCGQKKGSPVLFFLPVEKSRGKVSKSVIDEVESYLIRLGLYANNDLLNDQKTKLPEWKISGLVRSSQGKRSSAATELKRCIKI